MGAHTFPKAVLQNQSLNHALYTTVLNVSLLPVMVETLEVIVYTVFPMKKIGCVIAKSNCGKANAHPWRIANGNILVHTSKFFG